MAEDVKGTGLWPVVNANSRFLRFGILEKVWLSFCADTMREFCLVLRFMLLTRML